MWCMACDVVLTCAHLPGPAFLCTQNPVQLQNPLVANANCLHQGRLSLVVSNPRVDPTHARAGAGCFLVTEGRASLLTVRRLSSLVL